MNYQEERISHECIPKDPPSNPTSRSRTRVHHAADPDRHNDAHELVSGVGDQVVDLALGIDVEEVSAEPKHQQFEDDYDTGVGEGDAKELGFEFAVQTRDHGREEDIGHEGHDGDVHICLLLGGCNQLDGSGCLPGELTSSLGGRNSAARPSALMRDCCLLQGRCRQGKRTMKSFCIT